MSDKKKVGIYGGSFNPIHIGHIALVQKIKHQIAFEEIIIVPCKIQPLKGELEFTPELRLKLVQSCFGRTTGIQVSDFEIRSEGPSYAINTVEHYRRFYPGREISWILGTDTFLTLPKWHRFQDLIKLCTFTIVVRKDSDFGAEQVLNEVNELIKRNPGIQAFQIDLDLPEISSSKVREMINHGDDLNGVMPKKPIEILKKAGLTKCD